MNAAGNTISVVTPSLNQAAFLASCCASVADQRGAEFEHIVVDGGSGDGTLEWLGRQPALRWLSEADSGMYDAINKGLRLARGDILAVLNCDEQYLPATLPEVARIFRLRPEVDILFGDFLAVAPDGELLAYRKAIPLRWPYVAASYLYAGTCALFFRRRLLDRGLWFRSDLRYVADADFVVRALRQGFRARLLRRYLSVFVDRGSNLSGSRLAVQERREWARSLPAPVRWLSPALNLARLCEKAARGCYRQALPLEYEIFTPDSGLRRRKFVQGTAGFRWQVGGTRGGR